MAGKSDYLENKLLDHVLNATTYTSPVTLYFALFTAAPTDAGGGTEVSTNNYARKSMTANTTNFPAASGGSVANGVAITFATPSGSWGTITHFGIFDASTSGNLLYWGALTTSKAPGNGDVVSFAIGALTITED